MAAKNPDAAIEKQVNDLVSKYIYAAIADIKTEWNGVDRYPDMTNQNYANLCLAKFARKKLTQIFLISTEVKQLYTRMFFMLKEELSMITIDDDDDLASLRSKLIEQCLVGECCTAFIIDLGEQYRGAFGETLRAAADIEQYFNGKLIGMLTKFANKPVHVSTLAQAFNTFMKATAWIMAQQIWYEKTSISQGYFLGLLASLRLTQNIRDELQNQLRLKAAKPSKPKTGGKGSTPSTPNTVSTDNTAESEQDSTESTPDEPAKAQQVVANASEITKILEEMPI